jgi:hypothetical protein
VQTIIAISDCRSYAETVRVMCHELAHAWYARPHHEFTQLPRVVDEERVLAMAREEKWPALPDHMRSRERAELLADACAALWSAGA